MSDKIFENLYEYDFESCFYSMLNNVGYDLSTVEFDDKKIRNIQIGQLQKNNFLLKDFLASSVKRLLNLYIVENQLTDEDIVWKQKDGFIVTKVLNSNNITLPITLKNNISKLIKTMDNNKLLILYTNNVIDIKGLANKPMDISFYNLLLDIDFSNRKKVLEGCEYIRQTFYKSNNIKWFVRESKDGTLTIPMKGDCLLTVNKSALMNIDINDVDKEIIYNNYIYPFFQTLLIGYNQKRRY